MIKFGHKDQKQYKDIKKFKINHYVKSKLVKQLKQMIQYKERNLKLINRILEKELYFIKNKSKESIQINNILDNKNLLYKRRTLRLSLI